MRGALTAMAPALRMLMAFLRTLRATAALRRTWIDIADKIFRGARRGLLRVIKAGQLTAMQMLTDDLLQATKLTEIFAGDESDRDAGGKRAPRPTDTVDVIFQLVRKVEIDDVRDAVDVDTARGDVGRNQDPDFAVLESLQGTLTLALGAIGVDGSATNTSAV